MIVRVLCFAMLPIGTAAAGAWSQEADYGLSINSARLARSPDESQRVLFESYAEAGLGDGFTAVFTFESELADGMAMYGLRGAGGLRFSLEPDAVLLWLIGLEARITYQDYGTAIGDPVFAGDRVGALRQADPGRAFELWGLHAFVNLSAGWTWRGNTADEWRISADAGLDLDADWQAGAGYLATYAPGDLYDPGVYETHEAQLWLRWRIDADYALAISAAQTIAVDRAPEQIALRLVLWTFIYPEPDGD